ncbi:MAG: class I SAM-dependent methyltransferase [Chloroflexota bacterium]
MSYYVQYRPRYPQGVIDLLAEHYGFSPAAIVADVGSGTGFLSELFLQNSNLVYGVEPNKEMREAAETLLAAYPNFRSVEGTAEATTLADHSVDWVTAGQSFHWFDPDLAQVEFGRVLRPGGRVALIWNDRNTTTPFAQAYESLLERIRSYHQLRHNHVTEETLPRFFAAGGYQLHTLANYQQFDYESLLGRFLSSSYAPLPGQPDYEPATAELRRIFDQHQVDGQVRFDYETLVYVGQLDRLPRPGAVL